MRFQNSSYLAGVKWWKWVRGTLSGTEVRIVPRRAVSLNLTLPCNPLHKSLVGLHANAWDASSQYHRASGLGPIPSNGDKSRSTCHQESLMSQPSKPTRATPRTRLGERAVLLPAPPLAHFGSTFVSATSTGAPSRATSELTANKNWRPAVQRQGPETAKAAIETPNT